MQTRYFYINSDNLGFYKDFILGSWVPTVAEAHAFATREEAVQMLKALETIDHIKGLSIQYVDVEETRLLNVAKKMIEEVEANAAAYPSTEQIQIVVVEPQKRPYKKIIKNELESMKEIVDGWIRTATLGREVDGKQYGIMFNEEAHGKPLNRRILGLDFVAGTFFITAYNLQGDNISLNDAEAAYFMKKFAPMEVYL